VFSTGSAQWLTSLASSLAQLREKREVSTTEEPTRAARANGGTAGSKDTGSADSWGYAEVGDQRWRYVEAGDRRTV
jgi:hypothetical protein